MSYRYYEGTFDRFAEMEAAKPVRSGSAQSFDWRGYGRHEHFGLVFEGWLHVPEDGLYRFRAQADDASALYIDGEAVVRNETYDQVVGRQRAAASRLASAAAGFLPALRRHRPRVELGQGRGVAETAGRDAAAALRQEVRPDPGHRIADGRTGSRAARAWRERR